MRKTYFTVVLAICTVLTVSLAAYLLLEEEPPVQRPGMEENVSGRSKSGRLGEMESPDKNDAEDDTEEPGTDIYLADEPAEDENSAYIGSLSSPPKKVSDLPEGSLDDWNLILLGPPEENKIEKDIDLELAQFDTQRVDSRAADAYASMRDAAAAEGITLYLRSGYRSMETQRQNYNGSVQRYLDAGKSREEAVRLTNEYYTVPGHSEHHTGLAFDIITPEYHNQIYSLDDRFADTDAYTWLRAHCAEYGFILRYPKEKEEETQINFEPWHYRYVGVEHAQYIMEHGLCLEEYIELLKEAGR